MSNQNIFIIVFLGIVFVIVGAIWVWKRFGINYTIKRRINKETKKIYKAKSEYIRNITDEFREDIYNKTDATFLELGNDYEFRSDNIEYEVYCSLASSLESASDYSSSVYWWAMSLEFAIKNNKPDAIREIIKNISRDLENLKLKNDNEQANCEAKERSFSPYGLYKKDFILKSVNSCPDMLNPEKEQLSREIKSFNTHYPKK